jgi:hypothetical protein
MTHYVKFKIEGTVDDWVSVEVDEPVPAGIAPAHRSGGKVVLEASKSFQEAMATIRPAAMAIVRELREMADSPDNIAVEFGVNLTGQLGAVFASAEAGANMTVKLAWTNRRANTRDESAMNSTSDEGSKRE